MKIEGFHGYNVKFSPHSPFELGIVGGCNFGMTGNDIGDSEQFTTCFHGKRIPKLAENQIVSDNKYISVMTAFKQKNFTKIVDSSIMKTRCKCSVFFLV